jgi:FLVCR family feline leukemia virus subgroup C receptor-related protein
MVGGPSRRQQQPLLLPWFTFPYRAASLLHRPGFLMPLAAFVTSIGVTNVVSAFTESDLLRAGLTGQTSVSLSGAGFQVAIVVGGVLVGGHVDKTKDYKEATLACLSVTLGLLTLLGLAEGFDLNLPHGIVVTMLFCLGISAGPIQPINAELAVEVILVLS